MSTAAILGSNSFFSGSAAVDKVAGNGVVGVLSDWLSDRVRWAVPGDGGNGSWSATG